jgi:hypothetical protein
MKLTEHHSIELFGHKMFLEDSKKKFHRISKNELIKLQELITECLKHPNNNP